MSPTFFAQIARRLAVSLLTLTGLLFIGTLHGAQSAPPNAASAFAAESPAQRVDRLLAAIGGREAWTRVKFVHVAATHHQTSLREPFPNGIWNDFSAPRVCIEATIDGDRRIRTIADGKGFRVRSGQRHELTVAEVADEHTWWESNVYRTFHRLAVNDPELTVRCVGEQRLDIFRPDGKRLNWLLLNQRGEPVRFATGDSENASIFGPLVAEAGGVKHPRWGTSFDGSFRFEITRFETASAPPTNVAFTAP